MLRPEGFYREFVTFRPLPYVSVESSAAGGVLTKGQVVWAGNVKPFGPSAVRVYVDGVGMVLVDPCSLVSGDVFRERAISENV